MQGRQFFGRIDRLLEFLLGRIYLGLDCPYLGIDRMADIGNGLLERPQRIPKSFSQTLHIPWGNADRLGGLRPHRRLLRLHASHGILVDDGRRTFGYRLCLGASRKRRVLCPYYRYGGSCAFFHRGRLLALPRRLG